METEFNSRADQLIADDRLAEAVALLETAIRDMPSEWKPSSDDGESVAIACWDLEEFQAYLDHHGEQLTKLIVWESNSYSKAWYQLAALAVDDERFENAISCLDCGIALESDHPELWSERGYVLARLKRHDQALACYVRATSVRNWAPASYTGRALRGQAVQLIDLDRLDEAEVILKRSLEYDPDNAGAHGELEYIEDLRRKWPA
jgi:tetratricopeptide (TPR) repeat protein